MSRKYRKAALWRDKHRRHWWEARRLIRAYDMCLSLPPLYTISYALCAVLIMNNVTGLSEKYYDPTGTRTQGLWLTVQAL